MARAICVPDDVADIAGLHPIDYDEAFRVDTDANYSPQRWARLSMEGAPAWMRAVMVNGWRCLGIDLAPLESDRAVLGWPILRNDTDVIVLGIESRLGLSARIVIQPTATHVVHSMVVRHETAAARAAWAAIVPGHRAFVRRLLDVAASNASCGRHPVLVLRPDRRRRL